MRYLFDTNVMIDAVDGVGATLARMEHFTPAELAMAAVTAAELEASIHADPALQARRERATRPLLDAASILPFDAATARRYGEIVAACGYNRRRAVDRMIAATAIQNELILVTRNHKDFADIPGLDLEDWALPDD